tara:strand:- start:80 stop:337 length:258 start_codon:yes stop_codon:yes gene_type:complete
MSKNRKGILKISTHFINDLSYDNLSIVFQDIIVLNIESQGFNDLIYYCISKHFKEIDVACAAPEYVIKLETNHKKEIVKRNIESF